MKKLLGILVLGF